MMSATYIASRESIFLSWTTMRLVVPTLIVQEESKRCNIEVDSAVSVRTVSGSRVRVHAVKDETETPVKNLV
jgi:hypothetical protein